MNIIVFTLRPARHELPLSRWVPIRVILGMHLPKGTPDTITDRLLVDWGSGCDAAVDVSPDAFGPPAGPLDNLHSRISIRPVCGGSRKRARRHTGHGEGRLRIGS